MRSRRCGGLMLAPHASAMVARQSLAVWALQPSLLCALAHTPAGICARALQIIEKEGVQVRLESERQHADFHASISPDQTLYNLKQEYEALQREHTELLQVGSRPQPHALRFGVAGLLSLLCCCFHTWGLSRCAPLFNACSHSIHPSIHSFIHSRGKPEEVC